MNIQPTRSHISNHEPTLNYSTMASDKALQGFVFTETSSKQQGMHPGNHEEPTETPASMLPENALFFPYLPGDSYFFDESFNLLFCNLRKSDEEGRYPAFVDIDLDFHDQAPAEHGKRDMSPAETIVPDKLDSCQCQASVRR